MICRLCLSTIERSQQPSLSKNHSIIKNLISDVLPQVVVTSSDQYPVCGKCVEKLQGLRNFKDECIDVEDKIRRFKNSPRNFKKNKDDPVNIEDVFFHCERSKVRTDVIVCRTCFKPAPSIESNSLLGDSIQAAYLDSLFNDLDLNITSNPIICQNCSNTAEDFYQFQQKCILVQSTLEDLELADQIFSSEEESSMNITEEIIPLENLEEQFPDGLEDEIEDFDSFLPDDEQEIEQYLNIIASAIEDRDFNLNNLDEDNKTEEANEGNDPETNADNAADNEEGTFRCSSCQYKTKVKHYLSRHIKIVHQKDCNALYKCLYCEFDTKNKSTLDIHVKLEHDKIWETFECMKCNFSAKFRSLLTLHSVIKHDIERDSYQCPFCKYKTNSKDDFKKHHKLKHNDGIKTYDCLYCPYRTRYRCHLKTHIKAIHDTNERNYHKCGYCGYRTKWKSSLLMHIKFKHSNDNVVHECTRCDFKTSKLSRLKIHRKLAHETNDLETYLAFKNSLKNKFKRIENESAQDNKSAQRNESVQEDKSAQENGSAQENKGAQTLRMKMIKLCDFEERNEELHKCSFCNYSSKRRDTLQRHITAKHDDHRDFYKCMECEYQTKRKDALKRHTDVKHPRYMD